MKHQPPLIDETALRHGLLALAFLLILALILLTFSSSEAAECEVIRGQRGEPIGKICHTQNGADIRDRHGAKQGQLMDVSGGKTVIRDNHGKKIGEFAR